MRFFEQFPCTAMIIIPMSKIIIVFSCSALVNWLELHLIDPIPVLMLRYVVVSRE